MLSDFDTHLKRHLFGQWLGISVVAGLLCLALIRNSAELAALELLVASAMIIWGVSFAALRDQPGYWVYAALAPKFIMDQQAIEQVRSLRFTLWVRAMSPLQWPFGAPTILTSLLVFSLWLGLQVFPGYSLLLTVLTVVLLFPLLLGLQMAGAVPYFAMLASPEGEALVLAGGARRRRMRSYRREDLLISLLITYALIWPLHGNPVFEPDNGYASIDFIGAVLVLVWTAAFFLLLGARRSRLFSHVGERLSGLFLFAPERAGLAGHSLMLRCTLYGAGLTAWSVALCLILAVMPTPPAFPLFCLLLLPGLGAIYWCERGVTLTTDAEQARQYIEELSIAPASVARRGLERA